MHVNNARRKQQTSRPQDFKRLQKTSKDFTRLKQLGLKIFKRLQRISADFMKLQETSGDFPDFTAEVSLFSPWNNAYSSIGCLFSSNKTNSDT